MYYRLVSRINGLDVKLDSKSSIIEDRINEICSVMEKHNYDWGDGVEKGIGSLFPFSEQKEGVAYWKKVSNQYYVRIMKENPHPKIIDESKLITVKNIKDSDIPLEDHIYVLALLSSEGYISRETIQKAVAEDGSKTLRKYLLKVGIIDFAHKLVDIHQKYQDRFKFRHPHVDLHGQNLNPKPKTKSSPTVKNSKGNKYHDLVYGSDTILSNTNNEIKISMGIPVKKVNEKLKSIVKDIENEKHHPLISDPEEIDDVIVDAEHDSEDGEYYDEDDEPNF